jgi:hypothetical protein
MLFCERLCEPNRDPDFLEIRSRMVGSLLDRLSCAFPTINFRAELGISIINAQAVTTSAGREVKLYGGLAFQPKLGFHSLALVLLHEVGHHLSTGCRSPFDVTLACECAADHWSVTEGVAASRRTFPAPLKIFDAIEELDSALSLETSAEEGTEKRRPRCWSGYWPARKNALLRQTRCSGFCANL